MRGLQIKDGVVINVAIFDELPEGWVSAPYEVGISWTKNNDGSFSEPVATPPTIDELIVAERSWRNGELNRADVEVFKAEDTAGAFNAEDWRAYRQSLRAWPDSADFPDSTKRPIAPA